VGRSRPLFQHGGWSRNGATIDNRLSSVLQNSAAKNLAYAIRQYPEGKIGQYGAGQNPRCDTATAKPEFMP
jgi:hypothetical protein